MSADAEKPNIIEGNWTKYCTVAKSVGRGRPIWTSVVVRARASLALCGRFNQFRSPYSWITMRRALRKRRVFDFVPSYLKSCTELCKSPSGSLQYWELSPGRWHTITDWTIDHFLPRMRERWGQRGLLLFCRCYVHDASSVHWPWVWCRCPFVHTINRILGDFRTEV